MTRNLPDLPNALQAQALFEELLQYSPVIRPRLIDKPLILYGAGNLGRMARGYFDHLGIQIAAVVDVNADQYRNLPFWQGISVLTPDEVTDDQMFKSLLAVCVATLPFTELAEQLKQLGWCDVVMFYDITEAYRDRHPLGNGWFSGSFNQQDRKQISRVLQCWSDDLSRAHHLQFLAYRYMREDWVFADAPINPHDRYFIPEVTTLLNDHEVFVDVGAHQGEVVKRFLLEVGSSYQKIWLIEPDEENLRIAETVLLTVDSAKYRIVNCALADRTGRFGFYTGLGYASQLCSFASQLQETTTLDALNIKASFIKLHIEGGELDALIGSKCTLAESRPILAITGYHNRNGLWVLPLWLMDNLFDYQITMRLHSWCGTGAVLYAIPAERSHRV